MNLHFDSYDTYYSAGITVEVLAARESASILEIRINLWPDELEGAVKIKNVMKWSLYVVKGKIFSSRDKFLEAAEEVIKSRKRATRVERTVPKFTMEGINSITKFTEQATMSYLKASGGFDEALQQVYANTVQDLTQLNNKKALIKKILQLKKTDERNNGSDQG